MSILAIKGDEKRGNEVISLLEMLGGINDGNFYGNLDNLFYFISKNNTIDCTGLHYVCVNGKTILFPLDFTLDEFYEKYPYKVGDKVQSPSKGCIKTITGMKWDPDMETIIYELDNKIYTNADILNVHNNPKQYMVTKVEYSCEKGCPYFSSVKKVKIK